MRWYLEKDVGVKEICFLNMDASRIHLWAYCEYFKREGNWYSRLGGYN